jgi:hypothetical protein
VYRVETLTTKETAMYTSTNFKTKKALKEAVASDIPVTYYQPGLGDVPLNGTVCVEGPHYPKAHTWYAECQVQDGKIVKVK